MSLLKDVLDAFKDTAQPLSLAQLARRLDVEQGLVEDMIAYWVQKGKLRDASIANACNTPRHCASCAIGKNGCPFVMQMPKRYELIIDD